MSRWFRLDDDVINDPKILLLPEQMRWIWIAFLCIASKHAGRLPDIKIIALCLRVKPTKAAEYLTTLAQAGLIDRDETGFAPHNWGKRQFKSDVSTDRVKRFRKQERNVSETPPHTETHTQTETEKKVEGARKRGARLPEDWKPSAEDGNEAMKRLGGPIPASQELLKFHDYWKAQPGQRGVKLDWDATWRNWIRNAKVPHEQTNRTIRTNFPAGSSPTGDDAVVTGMARALERRRNARATADGEREFPGCGDVAGGDDPKPAAAEGDPGSHRQLALLPGGNVSK